MNDFVNGVIGEIMGGRDAAVKAEHGAQGPAISRPNYQREKAKRRLVCYDLPPSGTFGEEDGKAVSDNFSDLRGAVFSKLPPAAQSRFGETQGGKICPEFGNGVPPDPRGEISPDALEFAILENADGRVARLLGVQCRSGDAVGLAGCGKGRVGLLLAADRIATEHPQLFAGLQNGVSGGFLLKLSGAPGDIAKAFEEFKNAAQAEFAPGSIAVCGNLSVSAQRSLKLGGRCPAAVLDGVSQVRAAEAVQSFYSRNPSSAVEFVIGDGYAAAQGDIEEAKKALEEFRCQSH